MSRTTRYPKEIRERAIALVLAHQGEYSSQWAAIVAIASKIGSTPETLRRWVRQAECDRGLSVGPTSDEIARIKDLEREVVELRRVNEILKAASAFFARELDPRAPR